MNLLSLRRRVASWLVPATLAACAGSPVASVAGPPLPADVGAPLVSLSGERATAAAPALTTAIPDSVLRLSAEMLPGHGAADAVRSLTTEVGARLAGSAADKLAVAWAERAMRDRGLVNVHAEPVTVPVWQRGVEIASMVTPFPHPLAVVALGWSGATPASGVTADLVRFDSVDALQAADPKDVVGKIVFLDVRMHETKEGPGYGVAVVARVTGPEQAAKKGALAIVIRSIGSDDSRFPHTGSMRRAKDERSALPAAALSNADADLIERVLAEGGRVRLALKLGPHWLPDAQSANVVGEVVGRERPDEVVILGAHLDSWDLAEGAIDDGAGCGIVLEAGRALAALSTKPRRTVRIVLFAAEENSLAGGKAYAKAHAATAATQIAAIEADFGTGRVITVGFKGGPEAQGALVALAPLLAPLGVTPSAGEAHGGADITPLRELGVPLVDLAQDPARYFDTHHTPNDTFERVDPRSLQQAATTFATTAWALADLRGDLGRIPASDRVPDPPK